MAEAQRRALQAVSPHPGFAELKEKAIAIAAELGAGAAALEREGRPPLAEIDLLRGRGFLTALHDRRIGGGGLTWREALELVRVVARGESGVGQLLGYHYVNSQYVIWAAETWKADALARETVEKRLYWGAAVNPRDAGLTLTRTGAGFRLDGRKTFSTGAHISERLNVVASLDDKLVGFAVPTDRPGYIAHDDWDNIGLRLSDSGSAEFREFPVTEEDFIQPPFAPDAAPHPLASFNTPFIQLVFVNFYLGTAEGALAQAADYVRTVTRPWITSGVERAADDPHILERFGEFAAALKASAALADRAAEGLEERLAKGRSVSARERGEAAAEAYAAKVSATHVSLEVTARVFELMGARATASRHGFDRFWRNVRTHTLHDPVFYKAREVGDFFLNDRIPAVSLYS